MNSSRVQLAVRPILIGAAVALVLAIEFLLYRFTAHAVSSGANGDYIPGEAATLWLVLNIIMSVPAGMTAQMARAYMTHRAAGQQGFDAVRGWCDLERTTTMATNQFGGSELADHPMRDRLLDG